jgi:hypothetical protein
VREDVSAALRREVRLRAQGRCEYCFMPDDEPLYPHEADHIIAIKHRGPTVSENLAYACFECNRPKGSNIASLDPDTDALTPLYSPRTLVWSDHFRFNGPIVQSLMPIDRVTVFILRLNSSVRIASRGNLMSAGHYPHP